MGIWPKREFLNPDKWLRNFPAEYREIAVYLLDAYIYYDDNLLDELMIGAFDELARLVAIGEKTAGERNRKWNDFKNTAIFTLPEGEEPSASDSGYYMCRKARDLCGIDQASLMAPSVALTHFSESRRPIVFIDDFLCTGAQFLTTWTVPRGHKGSESSFEKIYQENTDRKIYYLTLFAFEEGVNHTQRAFPFVKIVYMHYLDKNDSLNSQNSRHIPSSALPTFKIKMEELGITLGISGNDLWGNAEIASSIALQHCEPDVAVTLYSHCPVGWSALNSRLGGAKK